jgi:hypothetical protein
MHAEGMHRTGDQGREQAGLAGIHHPAPADVIGTGNVIGIPTQSMIALA